MIKPPTHAHMHGTPYTIRNVSRKSAVQWIRSRSTYRSQSPYCQFCKRLFRRRG